MESSSWDRVKVPPWNSYFFIRNFFPTVLFFFNRKKLFKVTMISHYITALLLCNSLWWELLLIMISSWASDVWSSTCSRCSTVAREPQLPLSTTVILWSTPCHETVRSGMLIVVNIFSPSGIFSLWWVYWDAVPLSVNKLYVRYQIEYTCALQSLY